MKKFYNLGDNIKYTMISRVALRYQYLRYLDVTVLLQMVKTKNVSCYH